MFDTIFDVGIIFLESAILSFFVWSYHHKKKIKLLTVVYLSIVVSQLFFRYIGYQGMPLVLIIAILQYAYQCIIHKRQSINFLFITCLSLTAVLASNTIALFIVRVVLQLPIPEYLKLAIILSKLLPLLFLAFYKRHIPLVEENTGLWYFVLSVTILIGLDMVVINTLLKGHDMFFLYIMIVLHIVSNFSLAVFAEIFLKNELERKLLKAEKKNNDIRLIIESKLGYLIHNAFRFLRLVELKANEEKATETAELAKKYRIEMAQPKLAKTDNPIFNHNINDMVLKFKEKNIQLDCNSTINPNSPAGRSWNIKKIINTMNHIYDLASVSNIDKVKVHINDKNEYCRIVIELPIIHAENLTDKFHIKKVESGIFLTQIIEY